MMYDPSQGRSRQDRFVGCLLGLACGDALGMPLLDLSPVDIEDRYGAVDGYLGPDARVGPSIDHLAAGMYTADTQLALLAARRLVDTGTLDPAGFAADLGEWARRHDARQALARAPEPAVLLAGRWLYRGEPGRLPLEASDNGLLTVALVAGLAQPDERGVASRLAQELTGAIYHSDDAAAGAGLVAEAVVECLASRDGLDSVAFLRGLAGRAARSSGALAERVEQAAELLAEPPGQVPRQLGSGHAVRESLPAALYCFARAPSDPRAAIGTAINGGGDAPTVGALAGALAGCYQGATGLPGEWAHGLDGGAADYFGARSPGRAEIVSLALRLAERASAGAPVADAQPGARGG